MSHERTLAAIFAEPTRANLRWAEIESRLLHLGATISAGSSSRVRVALNGVRAVFQRPHPPPLATKPAVRSVRRFLSEAGVQA